MRAFALACLVLIAPAALAEQACPVGPTLDGIDVSKWQASVDWSAVAADGMDYAFIRVNHGLEDIDERFDENWAGARDAGLIRGAYQYFLIDEDPIVQARLLLDRMGPLSPDDLPPVIDVEDDSPATVDAYVDAVRAWIDVVEGELGVKPIIYSGRYFWESRLGGTREFFEAGYPFWFANYGVECPDLPPGWDAWTFWQSSATGDVGGLSPVDTDVFQGDRDALLALTAGPATCGDARCTGDETAGSCASDCRGCEPIPADGRVLDELDACVTFEGLPESWRWSDEGFAGAHRWTIAWDSAVPDCAATWQLNVERAGLYRIEVFTDSGRSTRARYTLTHEGGEDTLTLDQGAAEGFRALAEVRLSPTVPASLRLEDNTGEALADSLPLVFDAVRVAPIALDDAPEPEPAPVERPSLPPSVRAGCACLAPSSRAPGALVALGLLGFLLGPTRRRRR